MERIDLKAVTKHVVDGGDGWHWSLRKTQPKEKDIFSTVEFGGRRWTNDARSLL
jgi:hypothetical protein